MIAKSRFILSKHHRKKKKKKEHTFGEENSRLKIVNAQPNRHLDELQNTSFVLFFSSYLDVKKLELIYFKLIFLRNKLNLLK